MMRKHITLNTLKEDATESLMTLSRSVELKDSTRFVSVIDPQFSPDLTKVAFVVIMPDEKRDDCDVTIWVIDRSSGKPVTYFGGGTGLCMIS